MDIIESSHFEQLKQFLIERPWWEMKLSRSEGMWMLTLINQQMANPFDQYMWVEKSFGEALKRASLWVGKQNKENKDEVSNS